MPTAGDSENTSSDDDNSDIEGDVELNIPVADKLDKEERMHILEQRMAPLDASSELPTG